jgi:hypothetical protein
MTIIHAQELARLAAAHQGHHDPFPDEVIEEALGRLKSAFPEQRRSLVQVLVGHPDPRVGTELEKMIWHDPDPEVRRLALASAFVTGGCDRPTLLAACRDEWEDIRAGGFQLLTRLDAELADRVRSPAPRPARLLQELAQRIKHSAESIKGALESLFTTSRRPGIVGHWGQHHDVEAPIYWQETPNVPEVFLTEKGNPRKGVSVRVTDLSVQEGAVSGRLHIPSKQAQALNGCYVRIRVRTPSIEPLEVATFELYGDEQVPFRGSKVPGAQSFELVGEWVKVEFYPPDFK